MKSLSILLIPFFALSLAAFAQTAPQSSSSDPTDSDSTPASQAASPQHRGGGGGDRFKAADTNGDGKLSRSEAQAMPWVAKHFDEIDTNHDGYITREELRAARERMRAAHAQRSGGQSGNSSPSSDSGTDDSH